MGCPDANSTANALFIHVLVIRPIYFFKGDDKLCSKDKLADCIMTVIIYFSKIVNYKLFIYFY